MPTDRDSLRQNRPQLPRLHPVRGETVTSIAGRTHSRSGNPLWRDSRTPLRGVGIGPRSGYAQTQVGPRCTCPMARARAVDSHHCDQLRRWICHSSPMVQGCQTPRWLRLRPAGESPHSRTWAARRAKIGKSRRGKRQPPVVVEKMRQANLGKRASDETRRKMSATMKQRGHRPQNGTRLWTPDDDNFVLTLSPAKTARETGRTLSAIYTLRNVLGLRNGRSIRYLLPE